jgi:hypothetical protein
MLSRMNTVSLSKAIGKKTATLLRGPFNLVKDVRVSVACADFAASRRAEAMLEQVSGGAASRDRLNCSLWSFDLLAMPAMRQRAAADAAAADIIVIAAHGEADFSEAVKDWVSQWVSKKQDRPRALVCALDWGRGAAEGMHRVISQLKQIAQLGNMDFFSNQEDKELGAVLTRTDSAASPGNLRLNCP